MQALRESEERLRLALDAGKIGAWDWDIRKNTVAWSERIFEFHGLAPGSFGGRVEDGIDAVALSGDPDRARTDLEELGLGLGTEGAAPDVQGS